MNNWFLKIDSYRHWFGESNRKFAKRLGVDPSILTRWEQGMMPTIPTLKTLCKNLKIPHAELLPHLLSVYGINDVEISQKHD